MRTIRITCSTLLGAVLLVGCTEQNVPTASTDALPTPAFNWLNNPDNGNFRISRFEDAFAACWTDPRTGLRACHATIPLGGGTEPDCGLQELGDPADFQQVIIDADAFRIMTNSVGELFITIRDLTTAGDCFGAALVAEGSGTMRYTDNDTFGSVVNNTNAWGFMARGNLTTTGGAPAKYSGHARFNFGFDNQGEFFFRPLSLEVNLR